MYKQTKDLQGNVREDVIVKIENNSFIPFDSDNRDYQEYIKWLEEGNTPEPADE